MTRHDEIKYRRTKGGYSVLVNGKPILTGVSKDIASNEVTMQRRRCGIKERSYHDRH